MNSLKQVQKHQSWRLQNTRNEKRIAAPLQKSVLCRIHLPRSGGYFTNENQVESLFHS